MTIRNDNWIRQQCEKPTHIVEFSTGAKEYASYPFNGKQVEISKLTELITECNKASLNLTNDIIGKNARNQDVHEFSIIREITQEELDNWSPMIHPYEKNPIRELNGKKILSYGQSAFGYDVRLGNKFKIFTNLNSGIIDPLNHNDNIYADFEGDYCIIPPNSYLLGYSIEYFKIPNNVMCICVGKSTMARLSAHVNVTPIEPGFEGNVVIEISNASNLPLKIYANQGIAQFLFFQAEDDCVLSYKDKGGKYQGQVGLQLSKL